MERCALRLFSPVFVFGKSVDWTERMHRLKLPVPGRSEFLYALPSLFARPGNTDSVKEEPKTPAPRPDLEAAKVGLFPSHPPAIHPSTRSIFLINEPPLPSA